MFPECFRKRGLYRALMGAILGFMNLRETPPNPCFYWVFVARPAGIEPATLGLEVEDNLLYLLDLRK